MSNAKAGTWSLPTFDAIDITYTTVDRFGEFQDSDPDMRYTQFIDGKIEGVAHLEGFDERVPLGDLRVATIDLWEAEGVLFDVLDSQSDNWTRFLQLVSEDGPLEEPPPSQMLVLDELELIPEARGHGLGLHVLARAIRTWDKPAGGLVTLIAGPMHEDDEAVIRRAREALGRYWQRLGFEIYEGAPGDNTLVLFADSRLQLFDETIRGFCGEWESPIQSP